MKCKGEQENKKQKFETDSQKFARFFFALELWRANI